jgi:hypothetical protein
MIYKKYMVNIIMENELKEIKTSDDYVFCARGLEDKEKPLEYKSICDIKHLMNNKFGYKEGELSTAIDMIALYLKGQKLLYLEAKGYCEFYLNRLMMPCILLSSVCSVVSGIFNEIPLAGKVIAGATALNAFIMSIISYYKLDAKAEAHKMTAYSFDQLISECEFTSGKILLSSSKRVSNVNEEEEGKILLSSLKRVSNVNEEKEDKNKEIYDIGYIQKFINDIEKRVKDIKEKNQFMIPHTIRNRYSEIYNVNIFMKIKVFYIRELMLLNDLKVAYNDCRDVENKIIKTKKDNRNKELYEEYKKKYNEKEEYFKKILEYRTEINVFEKIILKAIKEHKDIRCCSILY